MVDQQQRLLLPLLPQPPQPLFAMGCLAVCIETGWLAARRTDKAEQTGKGARADVADVVVAAAVAASEWDEREQVVADDEAFEE